MKMISTLLVLLFILSGCQGNNSQTTSFDSVSPNSLDTSVPEAAQDSSTTYENSTMDWPEITRDGIDEELLLQNLNIDDLETVANELQTLVDEIRQQEIESTEFVLQGKWLDYVYGSEHYATVLSMGAAAMKPLYWIIYKSESAGVYEWICSDALDELSGFNFEDENGIRWADSKDFLRRFNEMVLDTRDGK